MNWNRLLAALLSLAGLALCAAPAAAQKPIRIGYPVILSGPGALIGEPSLKGAQMFVEEINAKGGVLGRKLELVVRDTKGNADEAVRVARDLILRENVDFLVGTLTSAEGPAVSPVAKENKIVFVVPVVKTDQLVTPANLHPYVFRTASNTTIEGRSAAEIMAKWTHVKRVATMSQDYAFGQDVTRAFVTHLKKIRPDIEIVDQQWPKLGEADYTPFINAQMAKKAGCGLHQPVGRAFRHLRQAGKAAQVLRVGEEQRGRRGRGRRDRDGQGRGRRLPARDHRPTRTTRSTGTPARRRTRSTSQRLRKYLKEEHPSSWPITGYIGMQVLAAAIQKANSTDSEKVAKAMLNLTVDTPIGKQTIRSKDQQANRAQFWGKMTKDPKYPFAVMSPPTYVDPTPFMD